MKLTTILPRKLYQRGAFVDLPLDDKLATLRDHNIRIVVSLWGPVDPDLTAHGVEWVGLPIGDGLMRDHAPLLECEAARIAPRMRLSAVLTQCHAGRNRSGLMSALLVRALFHCSGREALQRVRAARPRAVANPHFERYLLELGPP